MLQDSCQQLVFALKMVVERPLRQASVLGHTIHANATEAPLIEQAIGRIDDVLTSAAISGWHGPASVLVVAV